MYLTFAAGVLMLIHGIQYRLVCVGSVTQVTQFVAHLGLLILRQIHLHDTDESHVI